MQDVTMPRYMNLARLPEGFCLRDLTLEKRIGRGGFGAVYRARRGERLYAVKLPLLELASTDEKAREAARKELPRVDREISSLKCLKHPNVITITEFFPWNPETGEVGGDDGLPVIVMPFVDGPPLNVWVKKSRPSLRSILHALSDVAKALGEVHRRDFVHRDLKPSNILVDAQGHPVLIDFGIARGKSVFTMTGHGELLGTLDFFSPEYVLYCGTRDFRAGRPFPYSGAQDIYAFGHTVYLVLTGVSAWAAYKDVLRDDVSLEFMEVLKTGVIPPPSELNPAIPKEVDGIVLKMLERKPKDRYRTGEDIARALDALLAQYDGPNVLVDEPFALPSEEEVAQRVRDSSDKLAAVPPPPPTAPSPGGPRLPPDWIPDAYAIGPTQEMPAVRLHSTSPVPGSTSKRAPVPPPLPPPTPPTPIPLESEPLPLAVLTAEGIPVPLQVGPARERRPDDGPRSVRCESSEGRGAGSERAGNPARERRRQLDNEPLPLPAAASPMAYGAASTRVPPGTPAAGLPVGGTSDFQAPGAAPAAPSFVSPAPSAAAAPPAAPPALPSAVERLKAQLAPREREPSRAARLLLVLGLALLAALLAWAFTTARRPAPRPTASLLAASESGAAEASGSRADSTPAVALPPPPSSPSADGPTPTSIAVPLPLPAREPSSRSRSPDAQAVDELLAREYGGRRPTVAQGRAGPSPAPSLPAFALRAVGNAPEAPVAGAPRRFGIPLGAEIPARLVRPLDSRITSGVVVLRLARAYSQRGQVLLPQGTHLYGAATPTGAGRFDVRLGRLRLPDGTEARFEGFAWDAADAKPGLLPTRRLFLPPGEGPGAAEAVARGVAGTLLGKAPGGDAADVARAAGQAALGRPEAPARAGQEALLLDAPADVVVFVAEAF